MATGRASTRPLLGVTLLLAIAATRVAQGSDADEARKKAQRVASYVCLAETVSRVGLQVGGMLALHPFDRALATYARELGRLHESFYAKLTPPEGAETLHKSFKEAVTGFAKSAEAHCATDYATARKWRDECLRDFTKALAEVAKLQQQGIVPTIAPPPQK
jgi:hypothetical protein